MPIFGQVWLWSLAAFLLGVVLCWLLVVVPVRRRIDTLESRVASLRAEAKVSAAAERSARTADQQADFTPAPHGLVPGFDAEGHDTGDIRAESLTRAYALPGVRDVPSTPYGEELGDDAAERGALNLSAGPDSLVEDRSASTPTRYVGASGSAPGSERDWFDDQPAGAEPDTRLVDDEDDDEERGTIFTQRTTPISRELIQRIDQAGDDDDRGGAHAAPEPAAAHRKDFFADDLGDAEEPGDEAATEPEPVPEPQPPAPPRLPEREPARAGTPLDAVFAVGNGTAPAQTERHGRADQTEKSDVDTPAKTGAEPLAARSTVAELPTRTPGATKVTPGVVMQPERAPSALPKRIPAKPQHRHPFGVATVSPATVPASAGSTADSGGERIRSLFEPIVPAESGQDATPPPPHRLPAGGTGASASGSPGSGSPATGSGSPASGSRPSSPGPFGPGSAMPLPGGASPSPEFTVKASVTALRYCTPDSAQFGRTVAEVWFRSAADAERVGFRPVG